MNPNIHFEDGSEAPFTQEGEPIIKLFDGIPPLNTAEFDEWLENWHKTHNPSFESDEFWNQVEAGLEDLKEQTE